MKSVNYVIVELDEAYKNEVESSVGNIIINSTIESVAEINRMATVLYAPESTILEEGDEVIIHHNIARLRNDTKGNQVESNFHIEDNKYIVPLTEVFMYKRGGNEWEAISPYCFVKPIEFKDENLVQGVQDTFKGRIPLQGVMAYPNPELKAQGMSVGDKVVFTPYSEYEFNLGGVIHYKMATKDILAII